VLDRGLAYGDGLFETMRLHNGVIHLAPWHLKRLLSGAKRLAIDVDEQMVATQLNAVVSDIGNNCRAPCGHIGILKLMLTRGSGVAGYFPDAACRPNLIWSYRSGTFSADLETDGVELVVCPVRLARSGLLGGLKHLNRLEYVLAAGQGVLQRTQQWLLLDETEKLVETLTHNLFWVKQGTLVTPDTTYSGVAGVMRQWILEQASSLGLSIAVGHFALDELKTADEVFICNSVRGIWPVVLLEKNSFKPGAITRQLQVCLGLFWQ
jgi:4-amino-4-deoxychorismate lyase